MEEVFNYLKSLEVNFVATQKIFFLGGGALVAVRLATR